MSRNLPLIPERELRQGDVLLSKATGPYAALICSIDKSEYSHAALWSGHEVIEAVPHAVVSRGLPASVNSSERVHVDVFRLKGARPALMADITARAESYVGRPYALVDVLLVAHAAFVAPESFRTGLPELIELLRDYEQLGERIGLTCSELVARAFYEAGHPLELPVIAGDPTRSTSSSVELPHSDDAELRELFALCRRIAARDRRLRNDPVRSSGSTPPFHIVSPGDIERSGDFERLGELERSSAILDFRSSGPKPTPQARAKSSDPKRDAATGAAPRLEPTHATPRERAPEAAAPIATEARPSGRERLLYIALATDGRAALDSDGEYTAIRGALLTSKHRDHMTMCPPELRADALRITRALDWEQPTFVHVAGHADEHGMATLGGAIDVEHLQATLGEHAKSVRVVVLNACNTAQVARQLSEQIGVVIGMRGEIRDSAAKAFTEAFYLTLGNGRSVGNAFDFAREQLRQKQGEDLAQLEAKLVDPYALRIASDAAETSEVPEPKVRAAPADGADQRSAFRRWWLAGLAAAVLLAGIPIVLGATARPQATPAPTSTALIGGGVLHPGSTEAAARAAYDQCLKLEGKRGQEACTSAFETSVFAREVGAGDVLIPAFKLDRLEVTNEQLAHWLNAQKDRTRVEVDAAALARLRLPGPAVLLDGEWLALVGESGAPRDASIAIMHTQAGFEAVGGRERHPARMISWLGARLYCESQGRRLPHADEWEWAARGSEGRTFPWGERAPKDCSAVAYGRRLGQPCEARARAPEAVGTSEDVTPDGIYDLGGNVSEWVETAYGPEDFKHIRGGHFEDSIVMLGSARRFRGHRSEVYRQLGFRCAQSADTTVAP